MIKDVIKDLDLADREALMQAFENCEPFFLTLKEDHFIGVHMAPSEEFKITEQAGLFCYGTRRQNE